MKTRNIFILALALTSFTSCFSLNLQPEGVLSTTNPFTSVGEIQNYINQFYESGVRSQQMAAGGGSGICDIDINSDNLAGRAPVTRINGGLSRSNASKLGNYNYIRNVNFFLCNKDNFADKNQIEYRQLVGEAYYFRAWYYYRMFIDYGPVAIVTEPLEPVADKMKIGRNTRTEVADFIISDLKLAIDNLKEANSCAGMRIHKDVAKTLLSEVALFEGTWEKYHKAANDAFYQKDITDAKINEYLTTAATYAKQVMDRGVWAISTAGKDENDAYRRIFATTDLGSNQEILWYRKYDGDNVGNCVDRYLNTGGGGIGVTSSLVDDYLTIEGEPFAGTDTTTYAYGEDLGPDVRDPRLSQTVALPGQKIHPNGDTLVLPPFIAKGGSAYGDNTTGYTLLKHNQIDYTGNVEAENKGATPAIQFRYADVLLNYAEALAELDGEANAAAIAAAIKPLRDRVGMPGMDFDKEYNMASGYPFKNLNKYVQAVRRERRVEQAVEGRRLIDILRWAAADVLIRGWWPTGVVYTEEFKLAYPTFSPNLSDPEKRVYPLAPSSAAYNGGYGFRLDRDYLLPFQDRMISLTEGLWTQNPGWD